MATDRVTRLLVGLTKEGLYAQARLALRALEALLDPEDHLSHPPGQCTGECRAARLALGIQGDGLDPTTLPPDTDSADWASARAHEAPTVVGGPNPLEVEVSTKEAEASFDRLKASMDGAAASSQWLANSLSNVERVLGKLQALSEKGGTATVEMVGQVMRASSGDPRVSQVLNVVAQVRARTLSHTVAMALLSLPGLLEPSVAKVMLLDVERERDAASSSAHQKAPSDAEARAAKAWEEATDAARQAARDAHAAFLARVTEGPVTGQVVLDSYAPLARGQWLDVGEHVRRRMETAAERASVDADPLSRG